MEKKMENEIGVIFGLYRDHGKLKWKLLCGIWGSYRDNGKHDGKHDGKYDGNYCIVYWGYV